MPRVTQSKVPKATSATPQEITILFIGDIVGRIGRQVVAEVLPQLKKQYKPDAIIGNVENLAHGKGITHKSLAEVRRAGIDAFTGGNHIWKKEDPGSADIQAIGPIALPANDSRTQIAHRWIKIPLSQAEIFVLSLLGQQNMHDETVLNPFLHFERIREEMSNPTHLIVDFHAEMTSEKVAFGFFADGKASAVIGTHTHIPTADERILPNKTGYITDCGMTGSRDSVLGVDKSIIIKRFTTEEKETFMYPETGDAWLNAILLKLDAQTGHCRHIERVNKLLTIN